MAVEATRSATREANSFASAEVLEPPDDAYEQLRYHKRVMVAARV